MITTVDLFCFTCKNIFTRRKSQVDKKHGDKYFCSEKCYYLSKKLKLINKRFGRLRIVDIADKKNNRLNVFKCVCDCGQVKNVVGADLTRGHTTSCGCYREEKRKIAKGESGFNNAYYNYKSNAKNRGLIFEISREDFRNLTQSKCHYCGSLPSNVSYKRNNDSEESFEHGKYVYNGIDRVDSKRGYTVDNCVPCCGQCNLSKSDYSKEEFLSWVERVYRHSIDKL